MRHRAAALAMACAAAAGCGSPAQRPQAPEAVSVGRGVAFQPAPGAHGRCVPAGARRYVAHLELFAEGHVVVVPAGIGVRAPRRRGAYVVAARCSMRLRTREPTGVVEIAAGAPPSLGDLFATWGRPLTRDRLLGFRGRVRAYVGGHAATGDPRRIALRRHAQIVLVVGSAVPVHPAYVFAPGL